MRSIKSMTGMAAGAVLAIVAVAAPAGAQVINKCVAGKNKCVTNKVAGLLKCHATAEQKGVSPDAKDCLTKVMAKYDGGPTNPEKGCFAKLEAKYPPGSETPCLTFNDSDTFETMADGFVDGVVRAVDPAFPDTVVNKCSAGKKKCVSSRLVGVLKCWQKSEQKGVPANDKGCIDKATDKFDGGLEPAKGCFEKLEAKGGCPTQDDTGPLGLTVDGFVTALVTALGAGGATTTTAPQGTTTTSTSPTTTTSSTTHGSTTTTPVTTTTSTTGGTGATCGPNGIIGRLIVPFNPQQIPAMAAIRMDLRYPATVSIPGSGLETDDSRLTIVTGIDGTTIFVDRDSNADTVDDTLRIGYALIGGRTFPPGDLADILF